MGNVQQEEEQKRRKASPLHFTDTTKRHGHAVKPQGLMRKMFLLTLEAQPAPCAVNS